MKRRNSSSLTADRIGVFGKGGAGKSTVSILLARELRRQGYPVCILDADSTNLGLAQALGIDEAPTPLIEYFGGTVFRGGRVTCPVDDPAPLKNAELRMEEIPERYCAWTPDGILLLAAGKIGGEGPGSGCDGPISKIARDLQVRNEKGPHLLLLDFKAGFEDTARGVVASLDQILVVVDPTTAAIQMAHDMKETVRLIESGVLPATRHLETPEAVQIANQQIEHARIDGFHVVLNKVRSSAMKDGLLERLAGLGLHPAAILGDRTSVSESWFEGSPLPANVWREEMENLVFAMEQSGQNAQPGAVAR